MPESKTAELLAELKDEWTEAKDYMASDHAAIARLNEAITDLGTRLEKMGVYASAKPVRGRRPFLTYEEKAAPHFHVDTRNHEDVRLGAVLLGLAGGRPVMTQMRDSEKAIFSELTDAAGDVLVPHVIGSMFVDAIRKQTRVLEAGALSYPMESATVILPGWNVPPHAHWRAEGSAMADSGGSFRAVALSAKMAHCMVDITVELIEDAARSLDPAADIIESAFAKALAEAVDLAALVGDPAAGEPTGLLKHASITPVHLAGIPANYDFLLDQYFAVAGANVEPSAAIYSARTAKTLAKLRTGLTGDVSQLAVPEPIRSLRRLISNQVPDNLGVGTDGSVSFLGDWSQMVIGFRPELTVKTLRDPYTQLAATGSVRLYAWTRVDVGLLQPTAFAVTDEIHA